MHRQTRIEERPSPEDDLPIGPPMWGRLRLARTFVALRHPNFRLFIAGQLVSLVGMWMQNTALGWLVVLLASGRGTGSEAQANLYLGIMSAAGSLPVLFGALYGGIIADRHSKQRIIVLTQATQMGLALSMAALLFLGQVQIWHVIVLAVLLGMVNAFDIPARQAFVVEMVGRQDLGNAIALNSSIFNAARAVGPALAGLLIAALRPLGETAALAQCFLWNGLSFGAVIVGLLLMRGDFRPRATSAGPPLEQAREVVRYLQSHQAARLLITLVAIFSVFVVPYFVLLPSLARFTLGADARGFGFLMSCQGMGALVGALTTATLADYGRKGFVLSGASLVFPVLLTLLALSRSYLLSCFLVAGIGFSLICFLATANAVLQTSSPDALRGRVMGIYSLVLTGLTPLGSLWAGAVAQRFGAPAAIAVGAAVAASATLFIVLRYPRFRRMGRTLPQTL